MQSMPFPQPRPPAYFFLYDRFLGLEPPFPLLFCLSSPLVYLLCTYVIWPGMRGFVQAHRPLFISLRTMHNLLLFLYSGVCCVTAGKFMYDHGELHLVEKGFEPMLCNENMPDWMWALSLSFVASKAYEALDTAFLVWLRPEGSTKGLSFLHVYHHATTFWLFLMVSNFTSTAKQGMLFNGFVHTLMYAHYAFPFPKPLVPLITLAQIIQLVFVTWVWTVTPLRCSQHASFIQDHPLEFATCYAMVPVYLIFFIHFFVKRFVLGGGKHSRGSNTPKTE
eukprot:GGOE01003093.1.p1 GENE.GGOE01003093.1~~GGOE01003093.1.p1  ORF type:complete len:290 (-),score=98.33 GGOE01003093.1:272-1105(-)